MIDINKNLPQKIEHCLNAKEELALKEGQETFLIENNSLKSEKEQIIYEYQVGGSLPSNAPNYVVRKADKQLYQALKQGQFCYILNARQMGKSSLRIQVTKSLTVENIKCAAIDISILGSQNITVEQWYTGFTYILASDLNILDQVNIRQWWKEHQDLSPVQRLREFIYQIILKLIKENIVVFIDEIDSVLNLKFQLDDFFSLLSHFYNQRERNSELCRITFVLLGVANPSQLMPEKNQTPFKIGQAIELEGFKFQEAQSLIYGFKHKVNNPQAVLQEILNWTNGQPFLTQKLCLLISLSTSIPQTEESKWIETLIQTEIIENWEIQDNPEHLKTIRDRLVNSTQPMNLLKLYQQVWLQGEIKVTDSLEEKELMLSGLVIKQKGKLKVKNKIYYQIFNQNWLEKNLKKL